MASSMPRLNADSYNIEVRCGSSTCARKQLLRSSLAWRYKGVLHEYACCAEARSEEFLPGLWIASYRDGARARDPQTYRRDAEILERAPPRGAGQCALRLLSRADLLPDQ